MQITSLILTTLLSAVTLFVMTKIMGHKQVAQLDFFDYIIGITIGSIGAELATELEEPWKPFAAVVIYGLLAVGVSIAEDKFPRSRKYINGSPTIIMDNGVLYRENMKKAKLDLSEFMVMCRQAGYFNLSDIQTAVFEYNGRISILPVSNKRPANPTDMNLSPAPEQIFTEVIMDGRVLEKNLKRMGLDLNWLQEQTKTQGYRNVQEVYLGLCDKDHNLSLYPMKLSDDQ